MDQRRALLPPPHHVTTTADLEKQMYEMYPEWGPARHRTDENGDRAGRPARRRQRYWEPRLVTAGAPSVDEAETPRPDDN